MMKYYLKTFGCQMNQADSGRIAGVLEANSITQASEKEADVLIANICAVRQRAMDRVYALVKKWQNPKKKIVLTGCLLEPDRKKLAPQVDFILPIQDIARLPSLIQKKKDQKIDHQSYLCLKPKHASKFSAYAPIMNGCNNFCSYCVVPYTRGREISRPAEDILKEVKNLVQKGYKEITLVGQNVNSYECKIKDQKAKIKNTNQNLKITNHNMSLRGVTHSGTTKQSPFPNQGMVNFPALLSNINAIPGNFWIRFMTSHPKDMSDELIRTIAQCKKVCEYIHLPVQAGDDQILKKMNRHYTAEQYLKLVKKIRERIPGVALSTDVIVGFPSETRKQFENTVALFKKVRFDMAYLAQYSPRPQTAAFKLKDTVSNREKKRRFTMLNNLLQKIAQEKNQKLIGKIEEVLVEKCKNGLCFGKTRNNKTVKLKGKNLAGEFVTVEIKKSTAWGLSGKIKKS